MIHHVAIGSKHLPLLGEFYERLPGIKKIGENKNEDGSIRSIWFRSGESILMLESDSENRGPKALIFSASSLTPETSVSLPRFIQETEYTKYFKDPDGNLLGYSSYPEPWPF
ncbi:VOC family protein [Leptospira gomenensis]|uniref:VOC family protein n=1 Tax=Leptospira gomenensis TaxID=2484974 RepID=A0A5F1YAS7_9LEPT|nr:VOC family protein [Leptospira gomenensis]TGK34514.1 VOC family protein [Leptospira gomenensis]TGK40176.1 VOC family protein [Leptospira gomenensis]TGK41899.1 VOC family protein [Leptospira gomenensis]TGK55685.1 VOC family protein [Leptospira gomenensis]